MQSTIASVAHDKAEKPEEDSVLPVDLIFLAGLDFEAKRRKPKLEQLLARCGLEVGSIRKKSHRADVLTKLTKINGEMDLKLLEIANEELGTRRPVCKSNLQLDFNVSVFEFFDASTSAVLRELDESNRSVQKSAESTSI